MVTSGSRAIKRRGRNRSGDQVVILIERGLIGLSVCRPGRDVSSKSLASLLSSKRLANSAVLPLTVC